MHDYLENMVATLGAMYRKVSPLSDFELALYLGVVMVASLVSIASCIIWLRDKRKKKRHFLLERELYRVQETGGTGNRERKTVIEAFRIRFPLNDITEMRTAVEGQTDTTDEETECKYPGGKRA